MRLEVHQGIASATQERSAIEGKYTVCRGASRGKHLPSKQ